MRPIDFKAMMAPVVTALLKERERLQVELTEVDRKLEQARSIAGETISMFGNSAALGEVTESTLFSDRSPAPPEDGDEPEDNTKTDKARAFIKAAGVRGVKPKALSAYWDSIGMQYNPQLPYSTLGRLANKTKEIVRVGGRYYWKGFEPKEVQDQQQTAP